MAEMNELASPGVTGASEEWSSQWGFILATVGSAAGIGNIWRFSYVAGENGGGAFLLLYLVCIALIGLPIVIAELAIGRVDRRGATPAIERLTRLHHWRSFGVLSVVIAFLILSFYSVIAGWAFKYFLGALDGSLMRIASGGHGEFFERFIAGPLQPVVWQFCMIAATVLVVIGGVRNGIEAVNRVLMPALFAIVVGLAAYGLTLSGSAAGLRFLFAPDWTALSNPNVYLAAMGQAFFSLGVGMAIFVTYGSYLPVRHRIPQAACAVVAGDTLIAILAGIAIFSTVFAFGVDPASGPELAFITLPQIFLAMPGGRLVAILFFALLVAGALTSMVSMLEVPVAYLVRRTRYSRRQLVPALGIAIFLLGVPSALGFGPLETINWHGRGILDNVDHLVANFLLPAGGILIVLLVGWRWRRRDALTGADLNRSRWGTRWGLVWLWLIRIVTPTLILLIILNGIADV